MALFGLEALHGVETLASFVKVAPAYDALVWLMTALRGLVTLGQGMVVMLLGRRAPPTAVFGRAVAIGSTVVLTLEIGARLAPSNLLPGTRAPVIAAYSAYAVFLFWALDARRIQK